jgi:hypothetical protein
MTLDAMWEHVERLAAQHGITIDTGRVATPIEALAVPWPRTICIPLLRSAVSYATALHEMGHIVLGYVADERAAWEWARQNALVWSLAMERTLQHDRLWRASAGEAGNGRHDLRARRFSHRRARRLLTGAALGGAG